MPENEIYSFLKENKLTQKSEKEFLEEYSDTTKAEELHKFMSTNDLTNKDFNEFYDTYLKKKDEAGEISSEVGPSEEGELMSILKEDTTTEPVEIEVSQEDLEKPVRKEVAGDILTPEKIDPKLAKEIEEKLPEVFARLKATEEARIKENREIIDTMLPEIDQKLINLSDRRKAISDERINWAKSTKGIAAVMPQEMVNRHDEQRKLIAKQEEYLKDARDILKRADRYAETSDAGLFESMFKGTLGKDFFTIGISELMRDVDVLKVAKKIEAGESTTEAENMALYAYGLQQQIQGDVDPSVASMIGSGVRESIPFMIQLALTSPLGASSKEAAEMGVKKIIKNATKKELNKYVVKAIGGLTRAGVQTLGQTEFYKGGIREQLGIVEPEKGESTYAVNIDPSTQKSAVKAFGKSYAKTFGTVLIERAGGEANILLGRSTKKVGVNTIPESWMKRAVKNIEDATGFDDFLAETGEELLDGYKEAAFEGEFNPLKAFTGKEMLAMIGSVAVMRGAMSGAAMIQNPSSKDRVQSVQSLKKAESKIKPQTIADLDRIQQGDDMKKNAEQLDIYIKQKQAEGATDEDILKVVDYVAQKIRMDALSDAEQTIVEGRAEEIQPPKMEEKTQKVTEPQVEQKVAETAQKTEVVEQKTKKDEKEKVQEKVIDETIEEKKQEGIEDEKLIEGQELLEKPKEDAKETRKEIEKPSPEKGAEGKESEGLRVRDIEQAKEVEAQKEVKAPTPPKESRKALESRVTESVTRIGDVFKKKPSKLVKDAQSMAELDYIYDLHRNEIPFKEYNERKAKLRDKNKLDDDLNRIADIQDQVLFNKAKEVDQDLENKLGKDKYTELKDKRSAEVDKLVNSIGNLANIKRAVGDGKKLDVGKEFVQVAKSLANIGMINIELGTRQTIDALRKFISEHAPGREFELDKHVNLIARELGTREYDKKLAKEGIQDVTKKATERVNQRKIAEEEVIKARKKPFKDVMQRMFVDQSAPFKIALLKKGGPLARRAVDYFNTQSGMSGRSESEFSSARKKILGSFTEILDKNEQNALQEYLNYKRVIELDKLYDKRGQNRLKHEGDINLEEAEVSLEALQKNDPGMLASHDIEGPIDWNKIDVRANEYWNTLQNKLSDMYDEGLISEEVYNKLKKEQPYYSPRQYLENFIDVTDPSGSISGIEALSGGSTGSVLTDIQTLLADAISRSNNAIARNKTMQSLHDVATDTPNDVVKPAIYTQTKTVDGKEKLGYIDKLKKEDERLNKLEEKLKKEGRSSSEIKDYLEAEKRYIEPTFQEPPPGFTTYKFKKNGISQAIYLNNDYTEDFEQAPDAEWIRRLKNTLSWVSGNKILKAFATGYNPEFAVKNLPLDMMHILTTTEAYSPVYPIATAQMIKDIAVISKDAVQRKGRYKDFIEEGGSLEYLATQGSLSPKKFKRYNKMTVGAQALLDAGQYIQNTSEILTRLALRERMINNLSEKFVKENGEQPSKLELKNIQREATAYARNYLDFAQGGKAIKFMNSVIPYLNAGFQVTRGTLRSAKRNPKVFWSKMAQLGATATAITAYNLGMFSGKDDDEAQERKQYYLNDISDRRKADNFIVMTNLSYEKNDKKHYVYFAFPKDNAQRSITGLFEGALAQATGEKGQLFTERRWMEMQSLIQNVADLGNLPPIQSAILGSQLNKDLYYRTDIWSGRDMGKYKSQEYMPGMTPQRFIKASEWSEKTSEALGFEGSLSPVRMQYFVSQFTTKSNVLGSIMGEALDIGLVGLDKETEEMINKSTAERLISAPFARRFFKKTSPYVKQSHAKIEMQKLNAKRQRNDNKLKPILRAEKYSEAIDMIIKEPDPIEMQRLLSKFTDEFKKVQGIDYRIRELMFVAPQARARAFRKMWKEADKDGKQNLLEGTAILGYFNNKDFKFEIVQLMNSDPEFTFDIPE